MGLELKLVRRGSALKLVRRALVPSLLAAAAVGEALAPCPAAAGLPLSEDCLLRSSDRLCRPGRPAAGGVPAWLLLLRSERPLPPRWLLRRGCSEASIVARALRGAHGGCGCRLSPRGEATESLVRRPDRVVCPGGGWGPRSAWERPPSLLSPVLLNWPRAACPRVCRPWYCVAAA